MKEQTSGTFPAFWIAATVILIGLVSQVRADVNGGWVQTNGPYSGEILAIYAAPKGVLLVGTEGAGVFRSTDRGNTWTPANTGLRFEPEDSYWSVTAFAQKGETLYAGTRDGLYGSTDNGNTWHHVSSFREYESISGLVVIEDRIYVGTLNTGVWSSEDGDSWIRINNGLGPKLISELAGIGTTLVAATNNGVFRKADDEDWWAPIDTDAFSQPVNIASVNKARIDMGLEPLPKLNFPAGIRVEAFAAMEHLLYMSVHLGIDSALFRSNDAGESWAYVTPAEMKRPIEALAVYGGTLYASSGGAVYRSDDKGDAWTIVNDGFAHVTVSTLLAVNEDTVFVGTSGDGVFRTIDSGNSWVEINTGITNAAVSELEVIGDRIYAQVGKRIFHSVDGGESWHPVKALSIPTNYGFTGLAVSDGELYVGAFGLSPRLRGEGVGGIYRLDKESNAWVELIALRNLTNSECMAVLGSTFYMGTLHGGVFQWEEGLGPWATNLGLKNHYITALSTNGERVYAGADRGEIYRLKEGVWEPIHSTDMMDGDMSDLKWVGSVLYATFWDKGVFRSHDGGDSWTAINDGLVGAFATSIGTDGTEVYVSTFPGVFQWSEDGKQWKLIGTLPYPVISLAVFDGFLYAGTAGGGVFKIRIAE